MQNTFPPNEFSGLCYLGGWVILSRLWGCAGHMGLPGVGRWMTTPTRISRRTTTHISWVQNIRTTMRAAVKTGQQI